MIRRDSAPPDLFHRLSLGEPAALDEICRRYGERVMRLARSRMGKALRARLETADLAQEALLEIVRDAPRARFECEGAFLRWIAAVVENRIAGNARHWRAGRRRRACEVPLEGAELPPDPRAERPSQVLQRRESMDRLAVALASLSRPDREVLTSRLLLRLPWAAVAAALDTSEACAQMRYTRAKRRLTDILICV